jgi:hypothetical protein
MLINTRNKNFKSSRAKRSNVSKSTAKDDTNETSSKYIALPKEFRPESKYVFTRRFTSAAATGTSLTIYQLLAMKLVATTSILGNSVFSVVRIKNIKIWCPCVTQGVAANIIVTPVSFDSTDNNLNDILLPVSSTSSNIYEYAFVDYTPKKTHPSGMWHTSRAIDDVMLAINISAGAIIDIQIECIENTISAPLGFTRVLVGATAGTIYTCAPATGWIAQAVNSIA